MLEIVLRTGLVEATSAGEESANFTTPEASDEETGEDLGGLDDLLVSMQSDDEPAFKRLILNTVSPLKANCN